MHFDLIKFFYIMSCSHIQWTRRLVVSQLCAPSGNSSCSDRKEEVYNPSSSPPSPSVLIAAQQLLELAGTTDIEHRERPNRREEGKEGGTKHPLSSINGFVRPPHFLELMNGDGAMEEGMDSPAKEAEVGVASGGVTLFSVDDESKEESDSVMPKPMEVGSLVADSAHLPATSPSSSHMSMSPRSLCEQEDRKEEDCSMELGDGFGRCCMGVVTHLCGRGEEVA